MKRILLILSSLLLAGAAQAQVGVRVGANWATLSTKPSDTYRRASADGRRGYQLGVFYEKKLTNHLSLVPEVQLSRQNVNLIVTDHSIVDGSYDATYRLRLLYLNVPLLVRATFGKLYLEAGPQAGVLQAAHEKGTEDIGTFFGSYERSFDRQATDNYRRFDVGLCAGVGARLPAGFGVSLRAYTGLLSLTRAYYLPNGYGGKLKNQMVQASLSYQLGPRS